MGREARAPPCSIASPHSIPEPCVRTSPCRSRTVSVRRTNGPSSPSTAPMPSRISLRPARPEPFFPSTPPNPRNGFTSFPETKPSASCVNPRPLLLSLQLPLTRPLSPTLHAANLITLHLSSSLRGLAPCPIPHCQLTSSALPARTARRCSRPALNGQDAAVSAPTARPPFNSPPTRPPPPNPAPPNNSFNSSPTMTTSPSTTTTATVSPCSSLKPRAATSPSPENFSISVPSPRANGGAPQFRRRSRVHASPH